MLAWPGLIHTIRLSQVPWIGVSGAHAFILYDSNFVPTVIPRILNNTIFSEAHFTNSLEIIRVDSI